MLRSCSAVQSPKTKAVVIGISAALLLAVGMNLSLATDTTIKTFRGTHHLISRHLLAKKTGATRTLHLPNYKQFVQLPVADQIRYVNAFKSALVALDDEAKGKGTRSTASLLLDLWLSEACADQATADFCINVGVVRAVGDNCKLEDGEGRHNFDSRDDLAGLGISITCSGDQKPCSPIFGFDEGGNALCGSGNLTKSCAQQSNAQTVVQFVKVMADCTGSTYQLPYDGKQKCGNLARFFDSQKDIVEAHCQNSPATKACGILKAQIKSISDVDGALDAIKGLDQANQASSNLNAPKSDCPPGHGPAPTPPGPSTQAPANAPAANAPVTATTPAPDAAANGSASPSEDPDPTHRHHHDQNGQSHNPNHGGGDQGGANPSSPPPADSQTQAQATAAPANPPAATVDHPANRAALAPTTTLTLTGSGSTTPPTQQGQAPAATPPASAPAQTSAIASQQQAVSAPPAQTSQTPTQTSAQTPKAPSQAPAASTLVIPAAAPASGALPDDCKKMTYAADQSKDFSDILDSFQGLGPTGNQNEACDSLTLPNQSVVSIVVPKDGKEVVQIQPAPVNGKTTAPFMMTDIDALMIAEASAILGDASSDYKLSGDKLVAGYLPTRVIADAGAMPLPSDAAGATAPHARGWMTADGTVIRYRPDQITDGAKSNLIGIIPNATAVGGGHQTVFNFPLGDDDDQASNK